MRRNGAARSETRCQRRSIRGGHALGAQGGDDGIVVGETGARRWALGEMVADVAHFRLREVAVMPGGELDGAEAMLADEGLFFGHGRGS